MATRASIDPDRVVREVALAISEARDVTELADDFSVALAGALGECGAAMVRRREGDQLVLLAERGYAFSFGAVPFGTGISGRTAESGATQVIPDVELDPTYLATRAGRAAVATPITIGDDQLVVGVELGVGPAPEVVAAIERAAALFGERYRSLSTRARVTSADRSLARAFARLGRQRTSARLIELIAGLVGETLAADAVAVYELAEDGAVARRALWRVDLAAPEDVEPPAALPTSLDSPTIEPRRVLFPFRADGELRGAAVAVMAADGGFDAADVERAELLVLHAAAAHSRLRQYESAVALAHTDALTGLPNHRRFQEDARALVDAAAAESGSFALVVADIDDFKDLNDRRGHVAGDEALQLVGRALSGGVRPADRAYRLGGEEFTLLLPDTTRSNARTVSRRLQRQLAALDLGGWRLTVSMGIARYPEDGETHDDLLVAADAALYEAKRLGKDRITFADERLTARRTNGATMAKRSMRSFEQMRGLQALADALSRARDEPAVASAVLDHLTSALGVSIARVLGVDDDGALHTVAGSGPELAPDADAALVALAGEVRVEGRSFLRDSVAGIGAQLADGTPIASMIVAPCHAEHRLVGVLVVGSTQQSRFDRDDQRMIDVMSAIVGLSLDHARLLGDHVSAAGVADDSLDAIGRLAAAADEGQVIATTLEAARALADADAAWWSGPDDGGSAVDGEGAGAWNAGALRDALPAVQAVVIDATAYGLPGRVLAARLPGDDRDGVLAVRVADEPDEAVIVAVGRLAAAAAAACRRARGGA